MKLETKDEQGVTARDRAEQVYKTTGYVDPLLEEEVEPDPTVAHIMAWFWDLRNAGGLLSTGMGVMAGPLSAVEILSWSQLTGVGLTPFQYKAIREMDKTFLLETNKNKPQQLGTAVQQKPPAKKRIL